MCVPPAVLVLSPFTGVVFYFQLGAAVTSPHGQTDGAGLQREAGD